MQDYHRLVEEAIQAISVHSPTDYAWFGKSSARLPTRLRRALTPQDARNYLLYDLTTRLYDNFYLHGSVVPSKLEAHHSLRTGLTPFVAELSAANSGNGYWEEGWQIRAVEKDIVRVCRGDLLVWADPEDYMAAQADSLAPDMSVQLRFPKEFLSMSPGFYMALSDKPLRVDHEQTLVRIYWNLTADGAVCFMRLTTTLLNEAGLSFKLKVLCDPALFTRCDAAVIYILKRDYHAAAEILSRIYVEMETHLKPGIPVFTKPLAWGVGLAEDPGIGESFGLNRCRLVADAVIRAYEQGKKSTDERMKILVDQFAEDGINLIEPFLNAGSRDDYSIFSIPSHRLETIREIRTASSIDFGAETFLRTADELGWRLSHEAVWHYNQCNWIGAEPRERNREEEGPGMTYKALGPDLYSGTSGVALFLAELYSSSGAREARRTALGAIQQALDRTEALSLKSNLRLYTGVLGIVFAAVRIGIILSEQELLERATQLLHECVRERQEGREYDLLSGDAGAIVALMLLQEMVRDISLLDLARWLGDELLQNADDLDAGYSWKSPRQHYRQNLTGFSHGTAGIGYALLELFHATGEARYRRAAERAFKYERSWFDTEKGNWPDFREEGYQRKRNLLPQAFATFWCHGAPGIGLARLRAYEILNDATFRDEASIALNTTFASIETALHAGNGNFSLCHGLAGNAELLIYGRHVLGREWMDKSSLACEVGAAGIEASKRQGGIWPCGVDKGETPSLLLGLAGIGYFYLRLHNPAIPSILILRPEDFSSARS